MESLGTAQLPANPRVRVTYGEILPNRTIIDLVAPAADQDGVDLLRWDGKKVEIAPAIDNGIIYERPYLDLSVRQAMTFPGGASEYGTTIDLFRKILNLCREFAGLPEDLAAFATCWIFATWVPETAADFTYPVRQRCAHAPGPQIISAVWLAVSAGAPGGGTQSSPAPFFAPDTHGE